MRASCNSCPYPRQFAAGFGLLFGLSILHVCLLRIRHCQINVRALLASLIMVARYLILAFAVEILILF